jgi:23S rRNA A2030 N6-methylase RlmJ
MRVDDTECGRLAAQIPKNATKHGVLENIGKIAGMILVNPPWTLEKELSALLPALIQVFGGTGKPGFRLDWLAAEPGPDRP